METNLDHLTQVAATTVEQALRASFRICESLGSAGANSVQKNQFGDTALRGDIEAEDAVLSVLRNAKLHTRVFSEEHGIQEINGSTDLPITIGVLDGIDGSSVYAKDRLNGKYGTMFALFAGDNPRYSDYLAAGIMQHATAKLLLAVRGEGVTVINAHTDKRSKIHTKTDQVLQPNTIAYVDNSPLDKEHPLHDYFSLNDKTFAEPLRQIGVEPIWLGASAAYYAAIVTGSADIVGESTRKGNLEIATAYGLVSEAGGVMTTTDGKDIGSQRLLTFGQQDHVPVLTAANRSIANELIRHIAVKKPHKIEMEAEVSEMRDLL